MTLGTPGMSRLAWKGALNLGQNGVIYFLYVHRKIEKVCFSCIAHIHDTSISLPLSMDYMQVVYGFMNVIPMDLPYMPLDYGIYLLYGAEHQAYFYPLYRITLTLLKKLKENL